MLTADIVLWSACTASFCFSALSAWIVFAASLLVTNAAFVRWFADMYSWALANVATFILGITLLPAALGTRCVILLHGHGSYPPGTAWVCGGLLLTIYAGGWPFWWYGVKKTTGVRWSQLGAIQLGVFFVSSLKIRVETAKQLNELRASASELPYMN